MILPYTFTSAEAAKASLARFEQERQACKPTGYNADAEARLAFYLHRQKEIVKAELKKRYPETHQEMVPVTMPVTQFFVNELAKVFLTGVSMPLVDDDGKPVPPASEEAKAWAELQEDVALGLKLKRVDRYTTLLKTCFVKWGYSADGVTLHIVLPHLVEVVLDPAFPLDLDKAHLVRVELDSEAGPAGAPVEANRRFEVWCARAGEEQHAIVRGDGTVEVLDPAETYPCRDDTGRAMVPLVAFTQHTEELGLFPLVGQGLHEFNLSIDVAITALFEIAETQGWGELVITAPEGASLPPKITRGPRRAIPLKDGVTATILSYNAPIQALVEKLKSDLKLGAMLHSIPPGSVSLEARATASGVALLIEMRPLLEARQDSIEAYALPMRRLWDLAQITWNDYAASAEGETEIPATMTARWQPGDIVLPEDPQQLVMRLSLEKRQGWRSDAEAVAQLRGIPEDEATKKLAEIASTTKVVEPPAAPLDAASVTAGARAKLDAAAPPAG